MKKRFLSTLLCLCMVLGLVPATAWAATWAATTEKVGIYLRTLDKDADQDGNITSADFVEIPENQLKVLGLLNTSNRSYSGYYWKDEYGNWIDYGSLTSEKAATYNHLKQERGSDGVKAVVKEINTATVAKNSGITFDVTSDVTWDTLSWSDDGNGYSWHMNGELRFCKVKLDLNYTGADNTDSSLTRYCIVGTDKSSGFPTDPTRGGYTFDGWYTSAEGGSKVETIGTLTDDVTYYAHWTDSGQAAGGHTHYLCGKDTCNGGSHTKETGKTTFAKAISQRANQLYIGDDVWSENEGYYNLEDGTYYLAGSIQPNITIRIKGNVTLCLNGYTITSSATDSVITVKEGASLTLTDCNTNGKGTITHAAGTTGDYARGISVDGNTLQMYGGKITGNTASGDHGGGVYVENGTFEMYGGEITGNTANGSGGGVCVYIGSFTMNSGEITGNKTVNGHGGGVYVESGQFTMISSDSRITDNTATYHGGGVLVNNGQFIMRTGTITGNKTVSGCGGGVYVSNNDNSGMTVNGKVQITGNTKGEGITSANNVYLSTNKTITIDALTDGASIGVTTATEPATIATNATGNVNYIGIFKPDVTDRNYRVTKDEAGNVHLGLHQHSWTFTVGGATITATCKGCPNNSGNDYSGGEATITASDAVYSGTEKTASVNKTSDFEIINTTVTYSKKGDASFTGKPKDAGTYTAYLTVDGVTASVTYTIDKAAKAAPANLGAANDLKDNGKGKLTGTTTAMEYHTNPTAANGWITCGSSSTEVAPGTYYVRYKETGNYYASTVSAALTVKKHTHSGGTATCLKKAICDDCKKEYGELATHDYIKRVDNHYLKSAATCGSEAVYYKSCSVCGKKSTDTFTSGGYDATNHKHTEIRNVKSATEDKKGYTGDTWCLDCNKKIAEGSEVAQLEHQPKLVEAKKATVTEQGHIRYYYCENCGKYFTDKDGTKEISLRDTVTKKLSPEIIEGNNAVANKGEKKSLSFRSNALFADFIRVELDGKTLDEKNYTKEEGSIIITLNNDFVSTLPAGEHKLGIVSESGTATAKFTVKAADSPVESPAQSPAQSPTQSPTQSSVKSPKTGDDSGIVIWSLLAVISLAALGATAVVSKKKRER